jgi:uncharacterized membrane protein YphA (DoxX/SURF4 family)
MPSRRLLRAFVLLWWTLGVALLIGSIKTLGGGLVPAHHSLVALLAAVEAVAALLFLVPPTVRLGAAGLLLTLAVAVLLHLTMHELRWDLLLYAAGVYFVAVHGPLSGPQWRAMALRHSSTRAGHEPG